MISNGPSISSILPFSHQGRACLDTTRQPSLQVRILPAGQNLFAILPAPLPSLPPALPPPLFGYLLSVILLLQSTSRAQPLPQFGGLFSRVRVRLLRNVSQPPFQSFFGDLLWQNPVLKIAIQHWLDIFNLLLDTCEPRCNQDPTQVVQQQTDENMA